MPTSSFFLFGVFPSSSASNLFNTGKRRLLGVSSGGAYFRLSSVQISATLSSKLSSELISTAMLLLPFSNEYGSGQSSRGVEVVTIGKMRLELLTANATSFFV